MKKSEEVNLTNQIELIHAYLKKHKDLDSFFQGIDDLSLISIQDLSFEKDIEFFHELSFILSVILSIISKPHLNNKREEIIARSGEVSSVSEEDFQKTLKDTSIWKEKERGVLTPEYLYYHNYEDDIKIYENIFIVHLINEISLIIDHYSSLYVSLLNVASVNSNKLIMDGSYQIKAMDAANLVSRRISQIKDTYFYKEVSRAKNKPKVFYPTNILLKDRLYNICFKFYKKMYQYEEKEELNSQLFTYYFTLIIKVLHEQQYKVDKKMKISLYQDKELIIPNQMIFDSDDTLITLDSDISNKSFKFTYKDKLDGLSSSHLLIINDDPTFSNVTTPSVEDDIFTVEYLSLWHLGKIKKGNIELVNETLMSEKEMVESFINSHHFIVMASEKVYSSYCPSCKNKNLIEYNGYYHCPDCGSIFKFLKGKQDETSNLIVFAKLENYGRK